MVFEKNQKTAEIVKKYQAAMGEGKEVSNEKFARAFDDILSPYQLSYETVRQWSIGGVRPKLWIVRRVSVEATDWRRDFANEILAEMQPAVTGA